MSNLRKLISCTIISLSMIVILPVHATAASTAAYQAQGKVDFEGLTDNYIYTYPIGTKDAAPSDYLLMLNGSFISADVVGGGGCGHYVPVRTVADALGAAVDWDEQNKMVSIRYNGGIMTVTIGETAATVNGSKSDICPPFMQNGYTFVDVDSLCKILQLENGYIQAEINNIAYNPVIWLDSQTQTESSELVLDWLKSELQKGLESLKANLSTANKGFLNEPYFTQEQIKATLAQIQKDIDNTAYVEQIGRYYMFKGPYTILADYNTGQIYMYHYGNVYCTLAEANMSDPDTFVPGYFAD